MQKIVLIVVVIVVGLLAFNYFTTGELRLLPGESGSGDERELNRLRGEFRAAARVSGLDTTDAASAALAAVERVEKQVESLVKRTQDSDLKAEAEKLLDEIRKYKNEVG